MQRTFNYSIDTFYKGFDQQKFFDLFVNHKAWSKSDLLPGDITVIKPGKGHPQGLGATRKVLSGSMEIIEDIVGFNSPRMFKYAARNGSMPVNDFVGELQIEEQIDGILVKYRGGFNKRYFGTGNLFRLLFRRGQRTAFDNLEKVYRAYYGE
jgi:hypothetical protein